MNDSPQNCKIHRGWKMDDLGDADQSFYQCILCLKLERDELSKRLAELDASDAKDAARYRWLRDRSDSTASHTYISFVVPTGSNLHDIHPSPRKMVVDAAIDAAIEEHTQRTGPHHCESNAKKD